MLRKKLGRTGLEVTQLGYGSMGIRGPRTWGVRVVSEEDADAMLNLVLDSGINFRCGVERNSMSCCQPA